MLIIKSFGQYIRQMNEKSSVTKANYPKYMKDIFQFNTQDTNPPFFTYTNYFSKTTTSNFLTPFARDTAKVFFNILKKTGTEFVLFAGSSIGLLRDRKTPPYADDYDILIHHKHVTQFSEAVKLLMERGFVIRTMQFYGDQGPVAGYNVFLPPLATNQQILRYNAFVIDIFVCQIYHNKNSNSHIVVNNDGRWGLYSGRLSRDIVYPPKIYDFDGMKLPFMNNVAGEVQLSYGNINNALIHLEHGRIKIQAGQWSQAYAQFNRLMNDSVKYTKKWLEKNSVPIREDGIIIIPAGTKLPEHKNPDNNFTHLNILKNFYNGKLLIIYSIQYLAFVPDVKFYLPNIKVIFVDSGDIISTAPRAINYLCYCDYYVCSSASVINRVCDLYNFSENLGNLECIESSDTTPETVTNIIQTQPIDALP